MADLSELLRAVDIDTDREFDAAAAGGKTLREAFLVACKKLGHEFLRFTLVLRATSADAGALADVLPILAEATTSVVAGLQLLARPGAGATLQADLRKFGRALTQAVFESAAPIASGPLSGGVVAAQCQRMLHRAGLVLQLVEQAERLPVSNTAAVRRRLLQLGKLAKASADDLAREHAEASAKEPELLEEEDCESGDDGDAAASGELISSGCDALKCVAGAVRVVIALFDSAAREAAAASAVGAAASSSAAAVPSPSASTTADGGASDATASKAHQAGSAIGWPDQVAVACDLLKDAVVDFAAAVSDDEEVCSATAAMRAAAAQLAALCTERAAGHGEPAALLSGMWEALGELLAKVDGLASQ